MRPSVCGGGVIEHATPFVFVDWKKESTFGYVAFVHGGGRNDGSLVFTIRYFWLT